MSVGPLAAGGLWRSAGLSDGQRHLDPGRGGELRSGLRRAQPSRRVLQGVCVRRLHPGHRPGGSAHRRRLEEHRDARPAPRSKPGLPAAAELRCGEIGRLGFT